MSGQDNKVLSPDEVREITVKKPKLSQKEEIFTYMCEHGHITPLEAVRDLGCLRLAARIADLEKLGFSIRHDTTEVRNRFGRICRVTSYSLVEEMDG